MSPGVSFFVAFQAIAYRYVYYRKSLEKINPKFLGCPVECPESRTKAFDSARRKFCDDCSIGAARNKFKEKTLELWRQRLGKDAARFHFENLLTHLNDVIGCEDLPKDKISVKTDTLLITYLHEKNKARMIEDWQEKKD